MAKYLYRRGDGNEGNYPRAVVELRESDCPYTALAALLANDYQARSRTRRHIIRTIDITGEAEFGIHASIHEGLNGETAFGADWITAELQPLSEEDAAYECENHARGRHWPDNRPWRLRELLDGAALRYYRRESKR